MNLPAVDVFDGRDLLGLDLVEERREDLPGVVKLVGTYKVDLRSTKYLQNQSLVRVRQTNVLRRKY